MFLLDLSWITINEHSKSRRKAGISRSLIACVEDNLKMEPAKGSRRERQWKVKYRQSSGEKMRMGMIHLGRSVGCKVTWHTLRYY